MNDGKVQPSHHQANGLYSQIDVVSSSCLITIMPQEPNPDRPAPGDESTEATLKRLSYQMAEGISPAIEIARREGKLLSPTETLAKINARYQRMDLSERLKTLGDRQVSDTATDLFVAVKERHDLALALLNLHPRNADHEKKFQSVVDVGNATWENMRAYQGNLMGEPELLDKLKQQQLRLESLIEKMRPLASEADVGALYTWVREAFEEITDLAAKQKSSGQPAGSMPEVEARNIWAAAAQAMHDFESVEVPATIKEAEREVLVRSLQQAFTNLTRIKERLQSPEDRKA